MYPVEDHHNYIQLKKHILNKPIKSLKNKKSWKKSDKLTTSRYCISTYLFNLIEQLNLFLSNRAVANS